MNILKCMVVTSLLSTAAIASAATVTFSGLTGDLVAQSTYTEAGFTFTSVGGNFWGYPTGGQLHMDPSSFGNEAYDITLTNGGLFQVSSLSFVCCGSGSANLQVDVYGAGGAYLGQSNLSAATNYTYDNSANPLQYSRLRFTATGGHFSLDDFVGTAVAGVPEPATWGMMIAGFAMVGAASRRRSKAVTA